MKINLKKDKFRRTRGGHSRLLELSCVNCGTHLFDYQKDGPGILKRTYVDRIIGTKPGKGNFACPKCGELLGISIIYKKEDRPAIRLFEGAVTKKIKKTIT